LRGECCEGRDIPAAPPLASFQLLVEQRVPIKTVSEWCQNGVRMVSERGQNGVRMGAEWYQNGVTTL
jgi:hypothetical protein